MGHAMPKMGYPGFLGGGTGVVARWWCIQLINLINAENVKNRTEFVPTKNLRSFTTHKEEIFDKHLHTRNTKN